MAKTAHVIGNGDSASRYKPAAGLKITCNLPPFAVENVYTTCMVDFKMMNAIKEGSVIVPGDWVLGARPKKFMELNPQFNLRYAAQVKDYYTELPDYAGNYTNFNCGHMAVHYAAKKLKCDEIHMYGFDSIFDFNLRSSSDLYLISDREANNSLRLSNNWRPIWQEMFKEFPNTKFILHHKHTNIKIPVGKNVEIVTNG
jgi:hypothetical protein